MPARKRIVPPVQNERLAVLEERLSSHFAADQAMFADIKADIGEIKASVATLVANASKQRGFLAGASFAWTAVWSAVVAIVAAAISYFKS